MSSFKAITFANNGDSNVLNYSSVPKPVLGPNQVLVKNKSVGVNYVDLAIRNGIFPAPVQGVLGFEAAGIIEEVGSDVTDLSSGDRVVHLGFGSYSEYSAVDRSSAVKIPDPISLEAAAAIFIQGITALTLAKGTYKVKKGDVVVVHAAAGGVGQLLIKITKHLGATVIGITSSEEKAKIAFEAGADHVINYRTEDIAKRVLEITNGQGADVIYDSVGKSTFESSLESVKKFGTFVSFGAASGDIEPFDLNRLVAKNTLFAKVSALNYLQTKEDIEFWSAELFELYNQRILQESIYKVYPLSEVKQAHLDLESGKTTGKLILAA